MLVCSVFSPDTWGMILRLNVLPVVVFLKKVLVCLIVGITKSNFADLNTSVFKNHMSIQLSFQETSFGSNIVKNCLSYSFRYPKFEISQVQVSN